jgi:phospho-N-acetylmuramoyl-pentapeptide-transferase
MFLGKSVIQWLKDIAPEVYTPEWAKNTPGDSGAKKAEEAVKEALKKKHGVPSMGGILIVGVMDVSALFWGVWNELLLLTVLSMIVLAGLGFYDDYRKVTRAGDGSPEWVKVGVQLALGLILVSYLYMDGSVSFLIEEVMVPFYKEPIMSVGVVSSIVGAFIVILAVFGSSNAVNLTDGLDGLAIGCSLICTMVFLVITYLTGRVDYSAYLNLTHVPGACELTVFCAALGGACLGFLWFNCHPAHVFMGDTGSLAIGGAFGIMSVLVHQPFILLIAGGVFVMEIGSSALQRYYFKATRIWTGTGKRIFLRAPLHHHLQRLGWSETQVVTRLYIVGVIFAVLALASLKIR